MSTSSIRSPVHPLSPWLSNDDTSNAVIKDSKHGVASGRTPQAEANMAVTSKSGVFS